MRDSASIPQDLETSHIEFPLNPHHRPFQAWLGAETKIHNAEYTYEEIKNMYSIACLFAQIQSMNFDIIYKFNLTIHTTS